MLDCAYPSEGYILCTPINSSSTIVKVSEDEENEEDEDDDLRCELDMLQANFKNLPGEVKVLKLQLKQLPQEK